MIRAPRVDISNLVYRAIKPISVLLAMLLFGILGIRYVAAQAATTTDEAVASTTSEVIASTSTPDVSNQTSDTAAAVVVPSSEMTAPEEPQTPPAAQDTVSASEAVSAVSVVADEIANLEETYRRQTGRYLQIMPGNRLPTYETGSVTEKLGKNIPDNVRVDIYEAPGGFGYQISYEENGVVRSVGNGPEASARTYAITLPVPVATSTSPTQ